MNISDTGLSFQAETAVVNSESVKIRTLGTNSKKISLVAVAIFGSMVGGALIGAGISGLVLSGVVVPILIGAGAGLGIGVLALTISKLAVRLFASTSSKSISNNEPIAWTQKFDKIANIKEFNKEIRYDYSFDEVHKKLNLNHDQIITVQGQPSALFSDENAFVNADVSDTFQKSDSNCIKNKNPITEHRSILSENQNPIDTGLAILPFGRNHSKNLEDGFSQLVTDKLTLVAVMDGHGGDDTKKFLEERLLTVIEKKLSALDEQNQTNIYNALCEAFNECNQAHFQNCRSAETVEAGENMLKSGAAACVVLQIGNDIWTASAGDCRAIFVPPGFDHSMQISLDCSTEDILDSFYTINQYSDENKGKDKKICMPVIDKSNKAIGYTLDPSSDEPIIQGTKTCECLRGFGDLFFPGVKPEPKITRIAQANFNKGAKIVLVSDGVTKSASSSQVGNFVNAQAKAGKSNSEIASELAFKCRNTKSPDGKFLNFDDITVAVFNVK